MFKIWLLPKNLCFSFIIIIRFVHKQAMSCLFDDAFYSSKVSAPSSIIFQSIVSNLSMIFKQWEFHLVENGKILQITTQISSKIEALNPYPTKVTLELTDSSPTLQMSFITLKNNLPLSVKSKSMRILLCSYFMKINSSLQIFKFSICPFSGIIKFGIFIQLQDSCLKQLENPKILQREKTIEILRKIEHISEVYQYHIWKVLHLTNEVKFNIMTQKQQKTHCPVNEKYYKQIEQLNKILPITHESFQKSIKSCLQPKKQQIKLHLSIKKIIDLVESQQQKKLQFQQIFTSKKIADYQTLKDLQQSKTHVDGSKNYLKTIVVKKHSIKEQKILYKTQNSQILMFQATQQNNIKHSGSIKIFKKEGLTKKGIKNIEREQMIIKSLLKAGIKEQIAQYYEIKKIEISFESENEEVQNPKNMQIICQNAIFSKIYPYTLSEYLQLNAECMSIHSKLTLLLKILQILSEFHQRGYQHMDLKPENIVIDNRFNVKFIDFSQTVHPSIPLKESKPGVSTPYSPNQFYSKYVFEPEKCDTYSFGVIIFEMIFSELPICMPTTLLKIPQFYQKSESVDKLQRMQPEKVTEVFQSELGKFIYNFCKKCMSFDPKLRPSDEWLRIMLKRLKLIVSLM